MKSQWYVYLLECSDGTYYCGSTTNPERRIREHNGTKPGGARYTKTRRPVTMLACRKCMSRSAALKLEAAIKKLPRLLKPQAFKPLEAG